MRRRCCLPFVFLFSLLLCGNLAAQRHYGYYGSDERRPKKLNLTPSERDEGFALRFGLEGGKNNMATINIEYEINPYVAVGLGAGGAYHTGAAWGVPLYVETRAYAPNSRYSGYVGLRLGYMFGLADGKQELTAQTLYGYPLTRVDRLGGFMTTFGLGFSWKRLDAGINLGFVMGSFEKYYESGGETFTQWIIPHKAYLMASVQLSYSLRLWKKEPYNKVVKKN